MEFNHKNSLTYGSLVKSDRLSTAASISLSSFVRFLQER